MHRSIRFSALALGLALPLAACEQSPTAPEDGARAETTVLLSQGGSASQSLGPSFSAALLASAAAGPVQLSDVGSIDVTVTRVQALRTDSTRADSVVSLQVTADSKPINLLKLPTTAAGGLQLARGTLPAGSYSKLRIFLSKATVVFNRDVTVGGGPNARTYRKGEVYPLEIPGADESGIKVPTGTFTVAADTGAVVALAFDASASVKKVIATPRGIKMPPVLTASSKGKGGR